VCSCSHVPKLIKCVLRGLRQKILVFSLGAVLIKFLQITGCVINKFNLEFNSTYSRRLSVIQQNVRRKIKRNKRKKGGRSAANVGIKSYVRNFPQLFGRNY
jgi:hypothetical protein